ELTCIRGLSGRVLEHHVFRQRRLHAAIAEVTGLHMTLRVSPEVLGLLACPRSRRPLSWVPATQFAQNVVVGSASRLPATDGYLTDGESASPVVEGFPTLLWPDAFRATPAEIDIRDARYCEAYREMAHYNPIARDMARNVEASDAYKTLARIQQARAPD